MSPIHRSCRVHLVANHQSARQGADTQLPLNQNLAMSVLPSPCRHADRAAPACCQPPKFAVKKHLSIHLRAG